MAALFKFVLVLITWYICCLGKKKRRKKCNDNISTSSESSKISSHVISMIIEKLRGQQTRESTAKTYLAIWRQFNKLLLNLDKMPKTWEFRTVLFVGYLIEKGIQSSTIKSYVSAIKRTLIDDKYKWRDEEVQISSLTRACKIKNDVVYTRLPIHCGLLELILFEVKRKFQKDNQPYLMSLYMGLFILGYYGLMRVGELTQSRHVVKAANVHLAMNKDKLLVILYSSKTHSEADRPQKIKIVSNRSEVSCRYLHRNFCPFKIISQYLKVRGGYADTNEPLFIFKDKKPVTPDRARKLLKAMIVKLGLDPQVYDMHSLRIGRTSDLIKFKYPVEEVRCMARWQSNVIYKYIRQLV